MLPGKIEFVGSGLVLSGLLRASRAFATAALQALRFWAELLLQSSGSWEHSELLPKEPHL